MTNDQEDGGAAEMELEPHDHECIVERDSNEEIVNRPAPPPPSLAAGSSSTITIRDHYHESNSKDKEKKYDDDGDNDNENDGWGNWCNVEYEREDDEDEQEQSSSRPFKPSITIWTMEDSIHIRTLVRKDVCLTSTLFSILEEEKLDIVYENQYRTETKVAHTIQVRMKPGYDTDALVKKLRMWAGCLT